MGIEKLLAVHVSPLELVLRGTLMYWFLLLVFRFLLRRDTGSIGVPDILFIVIVADASQNAMAGTYDTVGEGCILVGTLVAWNYLLDWGSYRWKALQWLTQAPPVLLVDRGRVLGRNLRRELMTRDDLMAQLRRNGIASLEQVRRATMESDGKVSFLTFEDHDPPSARRGEAPDSDRGM